MQNTERQNDILVVALKPAGQSMAFTPGQYAAMSFKQNGRPTPARCFSILSTPGSKTLQIAMRVTGRFTNTATSLQAGDIVTVQGPFGDFTLNSDYDRRVVMLASGIGITPFMSMIRDTTERQQKIPITLLYSNRINEKAPFGAMLKLLAQRNPYFQVRFFAGDTTGPITAQHLQPHIDAARDDTTYFICGSKKFTQNMQALLARSNVDSSRIVVESFAQSSSVMIGQGWSVPKLTYSLSAALFAVVVGSIMALDLIRAVPKLASAQAKTSNSTTTQAPTTSVTTSPQTSSSDTTATTPSTTQTQQTPTTDNSTQTYTNYQQPVSRVS